MQFQFVPSLDDEKSVTGGRICRTKAETECEHFRRGQTQDKERLLIGRLEMIQYATMLLCVCAGAWLYSQNRLFEGWTLVIAGVAAVFSKALGHHGKLKLSRSSIMVGISSSIWLSVFSSGKMMNAQGVWAFPVVAMVASCLYDRKGTLRWSLFSGIVLTTTFVGDVLGWGVAESFSTQASDVFGLKLSMLTIYCVISFITTSAHNRQLRLTEQKCEEARREHLRSEKANQAKSQFLARMSHEIRTPMNGLLGSTAHLLEQDLSQDERHAVDTVHRCSENLLTLLNDALDLRKIELGQHAFDKAPTDLCLLIQDVTSLFSARAELADIKLVVELPNEPCWLLTDATRIRQVVSNLIGNALKFSDRGTIRISLCTKSSDVVPAESQEVEIEIQDEGIGMTPVQVSRLFQEFEQVHTEDKAQRSGTGLGLAISKTLVEGLGGQLTAHSEPGVGSTFLVCIPMQIVAPIQNKGAASDHRNIPRSAGLLKGLTALVVDDNQINLKIAVLALQKLGLSCHSAPNGQQAVEIAEHQDFDLIYMDIRMPVMDGIEATRAICRSGGRNAQTPIVALTANAYPEDHQRALEAGMLGFVAKPFRLRQLEAESVRAWQVSNNSSERPPQTPFVKPESATKPGPTQLCESPENTGSPKNQRISENLYHDRLKMLIRLAFAGGGGYTLMYIYHGHWRLVICDVLAMTMYTASEVFRRNTGSARWARDFFLFGLLASLLGNPTFGGQAESHVSWLFGILPIAAGHLKGKQAIVPWGAVTFCAALFLQFIAPDLHLEREFFAEPRDRTITVFISCGIFSSLAWAACVATEEQVQAFEQASIELIHQRHADDSASHSKSSFLANMSHELRTPMNGVLGMLEYLSLQNLTSSKRELVEIAQASGQRLLSTVNTILDFSKMKAGKFSLNNLVFDSDEVLSSLEEQFKLVARSRGLTFDIRRIRMPLAIWGDRERFRQLISIVLDNAFRYSELGTILLDVETKHQQQDELDYIIRVSDEGPGIPSENKEQLFTGSAANADSNNAVCGVGFGLAIASRLAQLMNGHIELESTGPAGTVFRIRVRMKVSTKSLTGRGKPSRSSWDNTLSTKVLIVDDSKINRKVAGLQLQRLGCAFEEVESGYKAIEMAQEQRFDLILMDLDMPGMNGEQAARMVQSSQGPNETTPIIAFTGHASGENLERAITAGMRDVLIKPASAKDIERVLRENLQRRRVTAA